MAMLVAIFILCPWVAMGQSKRPTGKPLPIKHSRSVPKGYTLVWNDEFEGKELDLSKWEYRYPGERDGAVISKDAVSLDGKGNLLLTTTIKDGKPSTGMVGTQKTFQKAFGYFEARIRFERAQGQHGAFWLQSANYGKVIDDPAACGAEIDIVEFFGSGRPDGGVSCTVFWNPYPNPKKATQKIDVIGPLNSSSQPGRPRSEICDDFHLFSLLWTKEGYQFFIDGAGVYGTAEGLSQCEQYIVLSVLSSEWERSKLDPMTLPDSMTVDYVRVYDRIKPDKKRP